MKKVRNFALTFLLMSLCISCAQQTMSTESSFEGGSPGTKAGNPQRLGITSKMDGKGTSILSDSLLFQNGVIKLPEELNEGQTLTDYILNQPGVNKDNNGNIILVSGKKVTPEDIDFIEKLRNNK